MSWSATPPRRDPMQLIGAGVLAVVLVLTAGTIAVGSNMTRSWFPARWDPRVAPIALEVARLRGLEFHHPVQIRYLTAADFEKKLGAGDAVSADDRADARREEAVFRALGFIGGKTDLLHDTETSETSGTLAFYDPDSEMIFVRGTTLDVEHRVTIAHELTHVLQDQNFDLRKIEKEAARSKTGDPSTLKGLVEGDAVRIERDYLKQLSPADQKEYAREDAAEGARIGSETSAVPDIIPVLLGAPYEMGPATVRVLIESDGSTAIDDALTGPTPSSALYVRAGDVSPAVPVDAPTPADGDVIGKPELFGPFEMFLAMSTRLGPARALEAADAVDGGTAVMLERRGVICYDVAVDAATEGGKSFLAAAVRDWAGGRPGMSVDDSGADVGFTACDPGHGAPAPSARRLRQALQLLGIRVGLTEAFAKGHTDGELARCIARVFVEQPGAAALLLSIGDKDPTPAETAQIRPISIASATACRDNSDAGLP